MIGHSLSELRTRPVEWHRRGMSHRAKIEAMVQARIRGQVPPEPTYGDFFRVA